MHREHRIQSFGLSRRSVKNLLREVIDVTRLSNIVGLKRMVQVSILRRTPPLRISATRGAAASSQVMRESATPVDRNSQTRSNEFPRNESSVPMGVEGRMEVALDGEGSQKWAGEKL
jgi:hypothetical protein